MNGIKMQPDAHEVDVVSWHPILEREQKTHSHEIPKKCSKSLPHNTKRGSNWTLEQSSHQARHFPVRFRDGGDI